MKSNLFHTILIFIILINIINCSVPEILTAKTKEYAVKNQDCINSNPYEIIEKSGYKCQQMQCVKKPKPKITEKCPKNPCVTTCPKSGKERTSFTGSLYKKLTETTYDRLLKHYQCQLQKIKCPKERPCPERKICVAKPKPQKKCNTRPFKLCQRTRKGCCCLKRIGNKICSLMCKKCRKDCVPKPKCVEYLLDDTADENDAVETEIILPKCLEDIEIEPDPESDLEPEPETEPELNIDLDQTNLKPELAQLCFSKPNCPPNPKCITPNTPKKCIKCPKLKKSSSFLKRCRRKCKTRCPKPCPEKVVPRKICPQDCDSVPQMFEKCDYDIPCPPPRKEEIDACILERKMNELYNYQKVYENALNDLKCQFQATRNKNIPKNIINLSDDCKIGCPSGSQKKYCNTCPGRKSQTMPGPMKTREVDERCKKNCPGSLYKCSPTKKCHPKCQKRS